MLNQKASFHGSDIEKIAEAYGIKKEEITNFSANVNPLGISPMLRKALAEHVDAIRTYPDRDYTGLRKAIAGYTGTDCQNIVVGNGATELISLLIRTVNPKKTLVIAPTYSEYEREIALNGGSCQYYALRETEKFVLDLGDFLGQLHPGVELLILCNPNNPTSSLVGRQEMEELLEACRKQGVFVLVDETYMEFVSHYERVTAVPLVERFENMAVLRGSANRTYIRSRSLAMTSCVMAMYSSSPNIAPPATAASEWSDHGFCCLRIDSRKRLFPVMAYPSRSPGTAKNFDVPRRTAIFSNRSTSGTAVTRS